MKTWTIFFSALSDVGSLCLGTKSCLLTSFEEISNARSRKPTTTSIVLDGAAIEQILKPAVCKNFREHSQEIFIPYVSTRFQSSSHLGQVCNTYIADSLRPSSRAKHGKRVSICVVQKQPCPEIGRTFSERTPTRPSCLSLSEALLQWFNYLFSSGLTSSSPVV
jgi:hypothetical protein